MHARVYAEYAHPHIRAKKPTNPQIHMHAHFHMRTIIDIQTHRSSDRGTPRAESIFFHNLLGALHKHKITHTHTHTHTHTCIHVYIIHTYMLAEKTQIHTPEVVKTVAEPSILQLHVSVYLDTSFKWQRLGSEKRRL